MVESYRGTSGIHLTGSLSGWATPKDLILHLAGKLTVRVRPWTYVTSTLASDHSSRVEQAAYWNTSAPVSSTSHARVLPRLRTWVLR